MIGSAEAVLKQKNATMNVSLAMNTRRKSKMNNAELMLKQFCNQLRTLRRSIGSLNRDKLNYEEKELLKEARDLINDILIDDMNY